MGLKRHSKKGAKREREYNRDRKEWLPGKFCKCCKTGKPAGQVHHMAGRTGFLLLFKPLWLPVCEDCHEKIEKGPNWANKNGYSYSRGLVHTIYKTALSKGMTEREAQVKLCETLNLKYE